MMKRNIYHSDLCGEAGSKYSNRCFKLLNFGAHMGDLLVQRMGSLTVSWVSRDASTLIDCARDPRSDCCRQCSERPFGGFKYPNCKTVLFDTHD
jgi:hypothetical protein